MGKGEFVCIWKGKAGGAGAWGVKAGLRRLRCRERKACVGWSVWACWCRLLVYVFTKRRMRC